MIGAQGRVPVFAYRRPADLRKGFEGLSGLVREALDLDPLSGALYLFTNRRRTTAKVLHFDGTGLGLYIKMAVDRAAVEIGVARADLEMWIRAAASGSPMFVPVHLEDEVADGSGLVVVLGCGVRVEGVSLADVAELARRLS